MVIEKLYNTFNTPINIVECGTIRGVGDNHIMGDGWSTYHWLKYCNDTMSTLYAVDNDPNAISACNKVIDTHFKDKNIDAHFIESDSIIFLQTFKNDIHLLYLDSYDYVGPEENIKKCHEHQLQEAQAAIDKVTNFVLIDDVFNKNWAGKGFLSIPFLMESGFTISHFEDSQVLLER